MKARLLPFNRLPSETHRELRSRLDQFYGAATGYTAFQSPSNKRAYWDHVLGFIGGRLVHAANAKVKVLEIGAGRSGFGHYLRERGLRDAVEYHAQDVTRYNEEWLKNEADLSFFGDILSTALPQGYDIIFSTYVLEHVTNPPDHLEKIWSLLADGEKAGEMFIFAPRYDIPGYICPSARHLPASQQLEFVLKACWARLLTLFLRKPQFLIQTDLAAFHGPFSTDADAVHWVSLHDLRIWAISHKASFTTLRIGNPAFLSRDWVLKRFCTTALQISKPK